MITKVMDRRTVLKTAGLGFAYLITGCGATPTAPSKGLVKIQLSGNVDADIINNAIATASTQGGGVVYLPGGKF
jgi:hypothetical protein